MSREPGADREANGYMLLAAPRRLVAWQDVLELGAGIGRFTAELAQHASSVVAVDFVEVGSLDHFRRLERWEHSPSLPMDHFVKPRLRRK
jgi:hypothetical protein